MAIEVGDRQGKQFEEVEALVDTSAVTTMLPGSMLRRLGVIPTTSEIFAHACGEEGAAPLLGAYALEGLRLGIDPYAQQLIPLDRPLSLR